MSSVSNAVKSEKTYGELLREWRVAKGWTQEDAAKFFGLSSATISSTECSVTIPCRSTAAVIDRLRLQAGLSLAQIAKTAGYDMSMISHVARGKGGSQDCILAIANALIAAAPSLATDVWLWTLSLGFAPPALTRASRKKQVEVLRILGVA